MVENKSLKSGLSKLTIASDEKTTSHNKRYVKMAARRITIIPSTTMDLHLMLFGGNKYKKKANELVGV